MDERRILCALTVSMKGAVRSDQDALLARAAAIADRVSGWMADKPHEAVVIEGFVGYPGRQGGYTFQTPYLCGFLHKALEGERLVIQTSRQVLNPRTRGNATRYLDALRMGKKPWAGSELLTNEHLRSAACHGAYYYERKRHETE